MDTVHGLLGNYLATQHKKNPANRFRFAGFILSGCHSKTMQRLRPHDGEGKTKNKSTDWPIEFAFLYYDSAVLKIKRELAPFFSTYRPTVRTRNPQQDLLPKVRHESVPC